MKWRSQRFSVEHEEVIGDGRAGHRGDTELGRTVAEGFLEAGHICRAVRRSPDELEVAAKGSRSTRSCAIPRIRRISLLCGAIPASPRQHRPRSGAGVGCRDPRTFTLADTATAWRTALDATVISRGTAGAEHRRPPFVPEGDRHCCPGEPRDGSSDAAIKRPCRTGQPVQADYFGTGVTINTVACGRSSQPSYDGLSALPRRFPVRSRAWPCSTTRAARHHRPDVARRSWRSR